MTDLSSSRRAPSRSLGRLVRPCAFAMAAGVVAANAAFAQAADDSLGRRATEQQGSGARDFDFEVGTWRTQLKRLDRPLSGSSTWVSYEGTSIVRPLLGGSASLVELDVAGSTGRIEGVSLRLYNPAARQWSLNYASKRGGVLTRPVTGEFRNGRGEFYGEESLDGRAILVRFVIIPITADSIRFEQAYSGDGARTWELNWIAVDTRVKTVPRP